MPANLEVPTKGNSSSTPAPSIQEQLAALELKRRLREEEQFEAQESRKRAQYKQKVQDAAEAERLRAATEAMCTHTQPDGSTCYGGQWCSDGKLHLVCGVCGKNATYDTLSDRERAIVAREIGRFGGSMMRAS